MGVIAELTNRVVTLQAYGFRCSAKDIQNMFPTIQVVPSAQIENVIIKIDYK